MRKCLALLILALVVINANAKDTYVDLRDVNIVGTVKEIVSPNIIKVETLKNGQRRHVFVELVNVNFGNDNNHGCKRDHKHKKHVNSFDRYRTSDKRVGNDACKRMRDWLNGQIVQVEVTEWTQPVLQGFVFLGSDNINNALIAKGWYPVDYMQTRDASLALLEKKARCQRVGIWQGKMGIREEDMKCQD